MCGPECDVDGKEQSLDNVMGSADIGLIFTRCGRGHNWDG